MFLGVCGGIAERWDLDPSIVRLAFALALLTGSGLIAYFVCALIIPRAPELGAGIQARQLTATVTATGALARR